jgi:hypothetical protein
LAATNRVAMSDGKRLDLAEKYWETAASLWPALERQFSRASHPLTGEALEAAKAALTLASELSVAYKHLLASEAGKRISLGGQRLMLALIHRCLQCTARVLVNSYLSYAPVPPRTWHDAHLIYAFARDRNLHLTPVASDQPERRRIASRSSRCCSRSPIPMGSCRDSCRSCCVTCRNTRTGPSSPT